MAITHIHSLPHGRALPSFPALHAPTTQRSEGPPACDQERFVASEADRPFLRTRHGGGWDHGGENSRRRSSAAVFWARKNGGSSIRSSMLTKKKLLFWGELVLIFTCWPFMKELMQETPPIVGCCSCPRSLYPLRGGTNQVFVVFIMPLSWFGLRFGRHSHMIAPESCGRKIKFQHVIAWQSTAIYSQPQIDRDRHDDW